MVEHATKNYLDSKINPILEKLVTDMLVHKPESIVIFYSKYLSFKKKTWREI
jgi:hypothetical protein